MLLSTWLRLGALAPGLVAMLLCACSRNDGAGSRCGDGRIDPGEECDGADFGTPVATCQSVGLGFTSGNLGCTSSCTYVTTGCNTCGNGIIEPGETCDDGNSVDDLTCSHDCSAPCGPGTGTCAGDVGTYCALDGSGVHTETCDALQGTACNIQSGRCEGLCARASLAASNVGCDFFPTVSPNSLLSSNFHFGVAVGNPSNASATVTVTQGAATISTTIVAANDAAIIPLPWVTALKSAASTRLAAHGAYRLRSTRPIVAYQFNPIEYFADGLFSYTNDASLLLPSHTWTGNYRVVARENVSSLPGFYSITASQNATTVTLTGAGGLVSTIPGLAENGSGVVLLDEGDVLLVVDAGPGNDVTGTLVTADKPVQVLGGHDCTNVPANFGYCDHLEESIFPLETLGQVYVVSAPLIQTGAIKVRMVRVVATQDATALSYSPAMEGAPTSIATAGGFFEIANSAADFVITANKPILVAEYMEGQDAGGGFGDPSMTLAVPTTQYRDSYLVHAPTNYDSSYANIVAPTDANVLIDGSPVIGWSSIGTSGYSVARVPLSNASNGNHAISADQKVGVCVYGYGQYTSYWYSGGSDLVR